ncbi:class I SAM-dependent methyltransferase [Pseudoroseicyclus sp. CXY001]|uniref:class I SAM-dependent methyltransferase n=1 Tax=Pseudoroseicyclus sp. CXY001 TaxID=3242492 RepID=UPI00358DC090
MAYDYDALYAATPDALGPPTEVIAKHAARIKAPGMRALDLGCGQGRDALMLARLGLTVHGIDSSPAGIAAMLAAAEAEGLAVTGEVADLSDYTPGAPVDLMLFDRVLHMLPEAPRHAALARLLPFVAPGGHLMIADETSNMAGLREIAATLDWEELLARKGYLFLRRI